MPSGVPWLGRNLGSVAKIVMWLIGSVARCARNPSLEGYPLANHQYKCSHLATVLNTLIST